MVGVGRAVGEAVDLPVEHIDVPAGQMAAQMVEGAAMAEAQLEDGARSVPDLLEGPVQAYMLGLEAEEEALQPGRLEQLRVLRGAAVFHVFLYSKPRAILRDGKFIPISGPAEYRAGTECLFKG